MKRAVLSDSAALRAPMSTMPSGGEEGISTTSNPAMAAEAGGFVPCAESGMMTSLRLSSSPCTSWYFLAISIPVYSPCAPPASGCSDTASMSEIFFRNSCSSYITLRLPAHSPQGGPGGGAQC